VLGAGKMGEALVKGISSSGFASKIVAADILESRLDAMRSLGVNVAKNNVEAVEAADLVILAVKPKDMPNVMSEISPIVERHHLVISIAAGVAIRFIEQRLPKARVIRAMPNIAATVGEAITALCPGRSASQEDLAVAKTLFSSVGKHVVVEERLMDAVTGLSGSGPGYVFAIIEALADGGVKMGLPHDLAVKLSAQTLLGSAKMLLEAGLHPGTLRSMVATPGGTTIEGLTIMEEFGVRGALMRTVEAATQKSKEISESLFG